MSFLRFTSSSRRFGKFALPPLVAVAGYSYSVFAEEETKIALSPKEFRKFRLSEVKQLSPNTKMYRYQFPNANDSLGLPVASCLVVKAAIDGKDIVRPYTPVSKNSERGHVDLVIKTYPAPYGKMSRHVEAMKVGDELEFKGPFQKFDYKPNTKKSVSMIAGGSGITPMLQVIREILENPRDRTDVHLIFANQTKADIILRNTLDGYAILYPNFHVTYCLSSPPAKGWQGATGFVTAELIHTALPPPSPDNMVLVCGPPGMVAAMAGPKAKDYSQGELGGHLKSLGYSQSDVFKF